MQRVRNARGITLAMTESEIATWLGLSPDARIRQSIIDGMADTPVPSSGTDQVNAFKAFLKCAGPLGQVRRDNQE